MHDDELSISGCIDEVRFCNFPEGSITIMAEDYCSGVFQDEDLITITKDCYMTITNPSEGEVVSGTVTVTADTNAERVKFYIDDIFMEEDMTEPFQYSWDTTQYQDGIYTIRAEGYCIGYEDFKATDTVTCEVDNSVPCLGTILIFLLVLLGSAGIRAKRNQN